MTSTEDQGYSTSESLYPSIRILSIPSPPILIREYSHRLPPSLSVGEKISTYWERSRIISLDLEIDLDDKFALQKLYAPLKKSPAARLEREAVYENTP